MLLKLQRISAFLVFVPLIVLSFFWLLIVEDDYY